ncbi:hypothetical protein [Amaricoccus solimangrovi]|uniref:Uncharacterized protein n=1 Tax=Amaricoccus solimangrovi TaxID=2589815 RepID=A0A501WR55_9RHOB|nr:hypothetical protein [Amaricoccus solimangrovi]TPE50825.1 hypothetical protein FJM51_11260 [Amaricoccus solimangrovi]
MIRGFKERDELIELFLSRASGDSWVVQQAIEGVASETPAGESLSSKKILEKIDEIVKCEAA